MFNLNTLKKALIGLQIDYSKTINPRDLIAKIGIGILIVNFSACGLLKSEENRNDSNLLIGLLEAGKSGSGKNSNYEIPDVNDTDNPVINTDLKVFSSYESRYIHRNATISYRTNEDGANIFLGSNSDVNSGEPDNWIQSDEFTFNSLGAIKVFAKLEKNGSQVGGILDFTYIVVDQYPNVNDEGIPGNDSSFQAWADGHVNLIYGLDVSDSFKAPGTPPSNAYGNPDGKIVVLGNHGEITITFSSGIRDGAGFDFAVFENAFAFGGGMFAELAYVEVSSDGVHFVRFDNVSLTENPVAAFGAVDPGKIYGYAGHHPSNMGTPFDLRWLKNKEEVVGGLVDLSNIRFVKIIDIPGASNYSEAPDYRPLYDSFGNTIYNPFKTVGSGGFDLQSIGVLNTVD